MDFGVILDNTLTALLNAEALYLALAAIGLNVHFGYTGLLNFGQAGFMMVAGYSIAAAVTVFSTSLWAGVVVGLLLAVVLWRALVIAANADDLFGRIAAAGIACWFGFQAFQNIGMCLGIMPVTGVPLPLMSYGGTSMFASLMAVGLLLNIHMRTERSIGFGAALRGRAGRTRRY